MYKENMVHAHNELYTVEYYKGNLVTCHNMNIKDIMIIWKKPYEDKYCMNIYSYNEYSNELSIAVRITETK